MNRSASKAERAARYRKGRGSELIAALLLVAKGYRIVAWRARTHAGEIDLIARRRRRLAFVEVKYRRNLAAAQAAISLRQQQRLIRAAEVWVSKRPNYHDYEHGMDAIFICPWSWPRHAMNAFYRD